MKGNILITGSSGFIGSAFTKRLQNKNKDFLGLSKELGNDITKWDQLNKLRNIKIIYHFAVANPSIDYSINNPHETYYTSLLGTLNMLELAKINKVNKFIFLSSAAVYGKTLYNPVNEEHPRNGKNPYAYSKILCEDLCKYYSESYKLNVIVLRLFNIYGGGQKNHFLIPTIINQLKNDKIELKNKDSKRDFLHIDDLTNLLYHLIDKNLSGFNFFNIGYGKCYSVDEVVSIISKIKNKKIHVNYSESYDSVKEITSDITKAKRILKWQPEISLEEGLRKIL